MASVWWEAQLRRLTGVLALAFPARTWLRELYGGEPSLPKLRAEGEALLDVLRNPTAEVGPTARVAHMARLSPLEFDLVGLAMLPELNDRFGDLFSEARGSVSARRPTLGLGLRVLLQDGFPFTLPLELTHRTLLWRRGLLRPGAPGVARADVELIPSDTLMSLFGAAPDIIGATVPVREVAPPETDEIRPDLDRALDHLLPQCGPNLVLYVPGAHSEGVLPLALRIARASRRRLIHVGPLPETALGVLLELPVLAWSTDAVLLVELADPPARVRLPDGWTTPHVVVLCSSSNVTLSGPRSTQVLHQDPVFPSSVEQSATWERLLGQVHGSAQVDLLGNRNRLSREVMQQAVQLAAARSQARGAAGPQHEDVTHALRALHRLPPLAFGQLTWPNVRLSDLVLPPRVRAGLEGLLARVAHRPTVEERWAMQGPSRRGRGVIALLHGESGTGKTLAADAIAHELGLGLLRVDLSQVVSKYIGETEKNLATVFDAAEGFAAVLLFDEADALFSRRTGVSNANDRWANLETNYLLQRLEAFEGFAVLSSNVLHNVDEAFMRRIPHQIHFPRPPRALQAELWARHLPADIRSPDVNLDALAHRVDMVGGEIRNVVLAAAYQAARDGVKVGQAMLEAAVRDEMMKKGKAV